MANKQATIQSKVKFSDLTKCQQDSIYKYHPVVKKLFLVTQTSNVEPMNTADYKFGDDVFKFLHTIDTIFGEKQAKPTTSEDLSTEQFILECCLTNCRLSVSWIFVLDGTWVRKCSYFGKRRSSSKAGTKQIKFQLK